MEFTPKLRNGLIIGSLVVATTALIVYFKRQLNILSESCYVIAGGIVHAMSINLVKITLFWKIVNESDLTIDISDMSFNVYVNGLFITKIAKPDKQVLYSKSDAIVKIDFEFNPKDLLRAGLTNIEPIIYDKEKLIITLKGTYSARSGIVKLKDYPFEESITLKELLNPTTNDKCKTKTAKQADKKTTVTSGAKKQ